MKYFTQCKNLEELKKEFRRLAMIHHPDRGGDVVAIKESDLQDINCDCLADTLRRSGWGKKEISLITNLLYMAGLERA